MSRQKGIKGYKAFYTDSKNLLVGRNNFVYEIGKEYELDNGELKICENGFHFCKTIRDCYRYYLPNKNTRICEIRALSDIVQDESGLKFATNKIKIVREIKNLKRYSKGKDNTGYCNNGDGNTGFCNDGDYNTNNFCNGYRNSGENNYGNRNSGISNLGSYNTGNYNRGNHNSGNFNIGNRNTGDYNYGADNSGSFNDGNYNTGDYNIGSCNFDISNYGYDNIGLFNCGTYNIGAFNTNDDDKIKLFNKKSDWMMSDLILSNAYSILSKMPHKFNIAFKDNPDDLKNIESWRYQNSIYYTCGYLTEVNINSNRQLWWDCLDEFSKWCIISLPNFDKDIFEQCTEIKISDEEYESLNRRLDGHPKYNRETINKIAQIKQLCDLN